MGTTGVNILFKRHMSSYHPANRNMPEGNTMKGCRIWPYFSGVQ